MDYIHFEKYKIFPMTYCPIRKLFYINIPKTKFIKSNKKMRFNFIIGGNIINDKSYLIKLIDGKKVNEINFIEYDNKVKKLNDNFYQEFIKPKIKIIKNYSSDMSSEKETFSSDDEYSQLGKKIMPELKENNKEEGNIEQFKKRKRIISCDVTCHLKSILRNKLGLNINKCDNKVNNKNKRVRFGSVEFSY